MAEPITPRAAPTGDELAAALDAGRKIEAVATVLAGAALSTTADGVELLDALVALSDAAGRLIEQACHERPT